MVKNLKINIYLHLVPICQHCGKLNNYKTIMKYE